LAEENGVDHAEDGGSGSDTEGEAEDRGGGEAGIPAQHAEGVS
jgi:hypothetical protein